MDLSPLPLSFYRRTAEEVAPDLLGRLLVRRIGRERLVLRLVEVEAYLGAPDRAATRGTAAARSATRASTCPAATLTSTSFTACTGA